MKTKLMLALCLLPLLAHAETVSPNLLKLDVCGAYKVLHINGVQTTRQQAETNLLAISAAYGNAHDKHRITYGLGYNQTFGLGMDIVQSIQQSISLVPGVTYADWVRGWVYGIFPSWFPRATMTAILTSVGSALNWRKPDAFFDFETVAILNEARTLGFVNSIYSRLLIVGHSQGTLFANILARRLIQAPNAYAHKSQIGLMSIAAFVPTLEGTGSQWVTNANDWPVMYGRGVYSDIKGNTVTIPHTEPETYIWRGHNLINKYLADAVSKKQITDKMKLVMNKLSSDPITPDVVWSYYVNYVAVQFNSICSAISPCTVWTGDHYIYFSTPYLHYSIVNSPYNNVTRAGTLTEATNIALSNAQLCYQYTSAEELRIRTGQSLPTGRSIWGCLVIPNYRTSEATWFAYSGDLPPTFKANYMAGYPINVIAGATCRQPAI